MKAVSTDFGSTMETLKADVHPPLYYQLLYVWVRVFGTGERAVRSLSALFYLFSIFAVYGIGRALYGTRTALLCAAIYLCSPLAILSAQFARMYALLSLLSILSTWLYFQFGVTLPQKSPRGMNAEEGPPVPGNTPDCRDGRPRSAAPTVEFFEDLTSEAKLFGVKPHDSRLLFVLYILVNVLGTFTHIAFFFVLFAQIVFHLLFYRRTRIKAFAAAIAISLLPYMFLWAPVLLRQFSKSAEGIAWVSKPDLSMVAELVLLYGGVLWLVIPVLVYLWWRSGFESFGNLRFTSLSMWLLAITILTPLLISQVKPIFNSRLAVIGLHLFALTIGAIAGRRSNSFLTVLLIVLTAAGLVVLHPGVTNCDNRAMAVYLNQQANDGDAVIFTSLTRLPIDYYLEQAKTEKKLFQTSFPAEIDQHPGYEGRITDPSRRAALEREGRELVESLVRTRPQDRSRRIFFFHGAHPEIDSIVQTLLRERFELMPGEGVKCELSPYFQEVSVYK